MFLYRCKRNIKLRLKSKVLLNAAAAAKSLQLCPTLCDPIDSSPPGSTVPGILQARTLEWVTISFSNAWKWKLKVKSLSPAWLFPTPWTADHQAPLPMGFSRQEYWRGLPLPSPGTIKWSIVTFESILLLNCTVDKSCSTLWLHGQQLVRPPCPSLSPWVCLKWSSTDSVISSNYLILSCPLLLLPSIFPSLRSFPMNQLSQQVAKVLELQHQHQSFQGILRVDLL